MTTGLAFDGTRLDFDKGGGLVTVVVQHARTDAVLMIAHADREALERTMATGEMHFHSRTRRGLWRKGETSGNVLRVVSLTLDCDGDAILARCEPAGPTCHTGSPSCFGDPRSGDALRALERVVAERAEVLTELHGDDTLATRTTKTTYTQRLLLDRNLRLKKLGEEVTELVVALADGERGRAAEEAGDVLYHLVVALRAAGIELDEVRAVLHGRAG
jgi:phosphoribosyl-ATP pyrophosphohydrolase/phosphoribosyl-AMP cyclohydrolase